MKKPIRPKIKHYPRGEYCHLKHLQDLIQWSEAMEAYAKQVAKEAWIGNSRLSWEMFSDKPFSITKTELEHFENWWETNK